MTPGYFLTEDQSHNHSCLTLNMLYEYDDFMSSVSTVADMGCGTGRDLEWWATRTTRDELKKPLNIRCFGIDTRSELPVAHRHKNIQYLHQDFEESIMMPKKTKFDVIWCHDAFQYVTQPFRTLSNWWHTMSPDGMLVLILPQNTNIEFNTQAFDQRDGVYHNWTTVSLMHVLATSGFDCSAGFFLKQPSDPWLHAVVYRSQYTPMNPKTTFWHDLAEKNLIPESAQNSLLKYGYVRQRDLLLPWLDRSLQYIQ